MIKLIEDLKMSNEEKVLEYNKLVVFFCDALREAKEILEDNLPEVKKIKKD